MTYPRDALLDDLAAFADLGTDAPHIVDNGGVLVTRMVREGARMELTFESDGAILERYNDEPRRHANLKALLASPSFANLGKWADSQSFQLKNRVEGENIPIIGRLDEVEGGGVEYFDGILNPPASPELPRVTVTLVNGPAGIGKTSLIRSLAYRRAHSYRRSQRPLILHVESRGRVLQNLTDLMAFSLQTLRLSVTYDQIPALVRNGLVSLAIDGFDELGDPSGYDLAWAQVNDLISSSRGCGNIVLAGRETFIRKERIEVALTAFDQSFDRLQVFTLCALQPGLAKTWLRSAGWPDNLLESDAVSPLFEDGSYALRPFFLSELAREGVATQIEQGRITDLLSFLINAMSDRETKKFGREIEAATSKLERVSFINRLMEEVARDVAENQSDSIPNETLAWLAEVVASEIVQANLAGILRNRAGVVAFLTDDDRRGYRRFVHEQVSNFFLSKVTIRAISENETPKYIRRNILGVEFLENFYSVFRHLSSEESDKFFRCALMQLETLGDDDRSRRNLATLILAACSVAVPPIVPTIKDISLDEVFVAETLSGVQLESVTIHQLYAREADMRALSFDENCFIASLVADDGTIPSRTLPLPSFIGLPNGTLAEPKEKVAWLNRQMATVQSAGEQLTLKEALDHFALFNLLGRVARYKPFWLKDDEEKAARRILDDPHWDVLKQLMLQYDLLIERHDVPASGRPAPFYHIKNRKNLLSLESPPDLLKPFLLALLQESIRLLEQRN